MNTKWRYFDDDGVPMFYHEGIETNADNVVDALNAIEEQLADMDAKLTERDALIERLVEAGNDVCMGYAYAELDSKPADEWVALVSEWQAMKGGAE